MSLANPSSVSSTFRRLQQAPQDHETLSALVSQCRQLATAHPSDVTDYFVDLVDRRAKTLEKAETPEAAAKALEALEKAIFSGLFKELSRTNSPFARAKPPAPQDP